MRDPIPRRMLGPITREMGGDTTQTGSAGGGGGGGGGSLTITNNVSGYMLKATGDPNRIEGISQLQYDSTRTTLTASAGIYITGSSSGLGDNYLYLHGTDNLGRPTQFKMMISGGMLRVAKQ